MYICNTGRSTTIKQNSLNTLFIKSLCTAERWICKGRGHSINSWCFMIFSKYCHWSLLGTGCLVKGSLSLTQLVVLMFLSQSHIHKGHLQKHPLPYTSTHVRHSTSKELKRIFLMLIVLSNQQTRYCSCS